MKKLLYMASMAMLLMACDGLIEKPGQKPGKDPDDKPSGQQTTAPSLTLKSSSLALVYPVQCDTATVLTFGVGGYGEFEYSVEAEGVNVEADTVGRELIVTLSAKEDTPDRVYLQVSVRNELGGKTYEDVFEKAYLKFLDNVPDTLHFDIAGQKETIRFETNLTGGLVRGGSSWLTKAKEDDSIVLSAGSNSDEADRTTTITIGDKVLSRDFVVRQAGDNTALLLEKEALVALYRALDGDNWNRATYAMANKYMDNWCTDKPVWEWYGIECEFSNGKDGHEIGEEFGHVRKVTLGSGGIGVDVMSGTLPEELKYLTRCVRFEIDGQPRLTGNIDVIFEMKSLQYFTIRECGLDFCINNLTTDQIERIKKMSNYSFSVGVNNITGTFPSWISDIPGRSIGLWKNRITGEIPYSVWSVQHWDDWDIKGSYLPQQDGYELTLGPAPGE